MDAATLSRVMGGTCSMSRYEQLAPAFNRALVQAGCNTPARVAMFCAQVGTESGGLQWMEELASGREYEGRVTDLGNTQPGDGVRYKGRSPIQVTGRANYLAVSRWAYARGYVSSPTYFVDNPEQLASDAYGFFGAVWYWTAARPMNAYADARNIVGATRAVNGGLNGLADRTARWVRALAMGSSLLPDASAVAQVNPVQALTLPTAVAKQLQTVLHVTADGIIGPQTLTAWQKRMGTPADGIASAPTSSLVTAVQSFLNAIRTKILEGHADAKVWAPLDVDGIWGPATAGAVGTYLSQWRGGFTTGH